MRRKIGARFIVAALLAGVILGMGVTAFAANQLHTGPAGTFGPYLGISYKGKAGIWHVTESQPYWAAGWGQLDVVNPTQNLPPHYMAGKSYLHLQDGTLVVANSSWVTNSSPAVGISLNSPHYNLPSVRYYYGRAYYRIMNGVDSYGSPIWAYRWAPNTPVLPI